MATITSIVPGKGPDSRVKSSNLILDICHWNQRMSVGCLGLLRALAEAGQALVHVCVQQEAHTLCWRSSQAP